MTPEEMAVQIGVAGYTAWSNSLMGNPPPAVKSYFERASKPQVGDLVVETSSMGVRLRDNKEPWVCVGILEGHKVETMTYEPEPGDEGVPETYKEEAWYIKVLSRPDDVPAFRWVNASFIAIPRTLEEQREFRGVVL